MLPPSSASRGPLTVPPGTADAARPLLPPGVRVGLAALAVLLIPALVTPPSLHAQGFYLDRTVQLPDTTITEPLTRLALPTAIHDARADGMGRARVADERSPSSFRYNPGLLGMTDRFTIGGELFGAAPYQTIDAVVFIGGNSPEFEDAFSLRALQDAVEAYRNGVGLAEQVEEKLAVVYSFAQELFQKVIGDPANPDVHGALFDLGARAQVGHWGFSLYAYGQSGMAAYLGPVLGPLIDIYVTTDFTDSVQAAEAAVKLEALGNLVVDPITGKVSVGALPGFYSLTYTDYVASAGYGFMPVDSLGVGVNLRVIHRRFSAARITANDAGDVTQKLFADLQNVETGLTFDVGAVYRTPSGLTLGMNLQNLIPVGVLNSGYTIDYNSITLTRDRDGNGNPIVNGDGDTALVASSQRTVIEGPAKLALPFIANIGASFAINENWDAAFELVDVAQQMTSFKNYAQRFGFGMEYRFGLFGGALELAPRIGFANVEPSFGLGAKIFDLVRLDAAYFTGSIVQARKNVAIQLGVVW
jgi:hypothetical protein